MRRRKRANEELLVKKYLNNARECMEDIQEQVIEFVEETGELPSPRVLKDLGTRLGDAYGYLSGVQEDATVVISPGVSSSIDNLIDEVDELMDEFDEHRFMMGQFLAAFDRAEEKHG